MWTVSQESNRGVTPTATAAMNAHLLNSGELSIVLSPYIGDRLADIIKTVTAWLLGQRAKIPAEGIKAVGDTCGLVNLKNRVAKDLELRQVLEEPPTQEVCHEMRNANSGVNFEDGGTIGQENLHANNSGYESTDNKAFFDPGDADGGEGGGGWGGKIRVAWVILGEGVGFISSEASAEMAAVSEGSITLLSFLANIWKAVREKNANISIAFDTPSSQIQVLSKVNPTSQRTKSASFTSKSSSPRSTKPCPTDPIPICGEACKPTQNVEKPPYEAKCTEGDYKECQCLVAAFDVIYHMNPEVIKIHQQIIESPGGEANMALPSAKFWDTETTPKTLNY
ncbi:uncharacterized protein MKZ38_004766 [Zalerion maritima]|uniref:Uncharacterized protein n=1 Tax=Zalerion maritima TaxID=339359 RepID=A0AAD5RLM9_9PEZI|nr:uncharacterized protein MKZ38_004766 [Zalerion maritima]